jgi:hypothetical protein
MDAVRQFPIAAIFQVIPNSKYVLHTETGHSTQKEIRTNPELEVWDASAPHIAIDKMWKAATLPGTISSIYADGGATPTGKRPVIDLEPHYEGMKDGLKSKTPHYFDEDDIRNGTYSSVRPKPACTVICQQGCLYDDSAIWQVFAGACGLSYGANSVWQMYEPNKNLQPACALDPSASWKHDLEALQGAQQLYILRDLFSTIDAEAFDSRVPSQASLLNGPKDGVERVTVTRDDGARHGRGASTFMWAYSGTGRPFELDLSCFHGEKLRVEWLSPRDGQRITLPEAPDERHDFFPPTQGSPRDDWVLDIRLAATPMSKDR